MTLLRPVIGIVGSTVVYYLLRQLGVSVYAALVVGAVLALAPACISLVRGNRPSGVEAFFTALLVVGFAIALLPGDERFLLAKDSVVTGAVGCWFLASLRWSDRPLAYQLTKPVAEGRLGWVDDWEGRWEREPWFRRMWRTASMLWAAATVLDAVARVVMAYTLPADVVPGLNLATYVATVALVNALTTVVYVRAGAVGARARVRHQNPEIQTP